MSPVPSETLLMLASLLLGAAPLEEAKAMRAAGVRVPAWVPFAVLTGFGIASVIFDLSNPELIAAAFGQV
jgi:hypothetical protein